jgi:hypothetical protein
MSAPEQTPLLPKELHIYISLAGMCPPHLNYVLSIISITLITLPKLLQAAYEEDCF